MPDPKTPHGIVAELDLAAEYLFELREDFETDFASPEGTLKELERVRRHIDEAHANLAAIVAEGGYRTRLRGS